MRIRVLVISVVFSLFPLAGFAGADHDHGSHDHGSHSHDPISQSQAEEAAAKRIAKLIDKRKIVDSWKEAKLVKSEKKQFDSKTEWVVSFVNDKIESDNKKTLYIFLSLNGDYIAANHTGK